MNLIEANNLSKNYDLKAKRKVIAVNNVDLTIQKGEIVGLVGESGCGKSTLGKLLLKLETTTKGNILFKGEDITDYSFNKMRPLRKNMQMIFQNSLNAFNPYITVKQTLLEPLKNYNKKMMINEQISIMENILKKVGLDKKYMLRYPSELSGGQRQRVGIARALILNPEFVVCDEPTSSVDYAVRNQILDLLVALKEQLELTYLFISHDISSVNKICSRVLVMYMGNIVEVIPSMDDNILHPYTKGLRAATLLADPKKRMDKTVLFHEEQESKVFDKGCAFQNRCLYTKDICRNKVPVLTKIDNSLDHFVACHLCNMKI